MSQPVIVIVHGMGSFEKPNPGENTPGTFGGEFIRAANTALGYYDFPDGARIQDQAKIIEIHYNDIFDDMRKKIADSGKTISDFIGAAASGAVLGHVPGLIKEITDFESSLNEDSMIYTHWLDVIFYKLYPGAYVRTRVAEALANIISEHGVHDLHIVAHSLGTAVIHDTLHQLYSGHYADNDAIPDLSCDTHKIASLWMVANVSRLASTVLPVEDPYLSLVKPGTGLCSSLFNFNHTLDPFTLPRGFRREATDGWIDSQLHNLQYFDKRPHLVSEINTHSIEQYIRDPMFNLRFFKVVLNKTITEAQFMTAQRNYESTTINGAAEALKDTYKDINTSDSATLTDFYKAAKKLKEVIEEGVSND